MTSRPSAPTRVLLLGEHSPSFPPHAATVEALQHSAAELGVDVEPTWMSTADVSSAWPEEFDGLWVAPGSPYRSLERTLAAIRVARERNVPCLGTCGGFQHMLIEYARNALGFQDAQHAEYDPYASNLFVSGLACSLTGRDLELRFVPGSRVARIYGSERARERYYCDFGVNPDKVELLRQGPLAISGSDDEGEVRVVELPAHPFFVGTLFVPQLRSEPDRPHPLVTAFVRSLTGARARAIG